MKALCLPAVFTLTLVLAACSSTRSPAPALAAPTPTQTATTSPTSNPSPGDADLARVDQQGAVVIEVKPLDLKRSDNLEFEVSMNTHSVDLSMDLAALATLNTDTGLTVQATLWDGPHGGHHVSGKLIFPATRDGKSILEGAHRLTLTIVNLDAPSRVFEWQLK
jgi:hypothetical protein